MNSIGLRQVIKEFHELPKIGQDAILRDVYNYSDELRLLLSNRLIGTADFESMVRKMERETIGKVYRKGIPGTPNGRTVNAIIIAAKKARAQYDVIMRLEQLAYRGFIEFLHEYGGGPEGLEEQAGKHLKVYLDIVKERLTSDKQQAVFDDVKRYLFKKDNMNTDYIDETFERASGKRMSR